MFTVKLIKNVDSSEEIIVYRETSKVTIHPYSQSSDGLTSGKEEVFLQSPDNGNVYHSIKRGEDFDVLYIMNQKGTTIDKI